MAEVRLISLLLCWAGIVTALAHRYPGRRTPLILGSAIGFITGVAGGALLLANFQSSVLYGVIKTLTGGSFLVLWGGAAAALYRVTGRGGGIVQGQPGKYQVLPLSGSALFAGLVSGAILACLVVPGGGIPLTFMLLAGTAGALFAVLAVASQRFIPPFVQVTSEALLAWLVALLLLESSFSIQLDLFSPLTMKVMKFIHDFVHQLFESMLIPDHPFFRLDVWNYIGYLFSRGVGFWGGLAVWFAPVLMIILAVSLDRLPSVAHIRQGAKRRKLLAAFIRERRCRLILPCFAMIILALTVYKSSFPGVEYWDPKPLAVTVTPSGEIVIQKKGEVDLEDGKLHKYHLKQGGREARFMVLLTPDGKLTVTLDACAICKPDGYGQTEGSVICYYCKTLIPVETVGKPGGCNPVPVPFKDADGVVSLDAMTLLNRWGDTVTATARIEGGGK